MTYDREDTPTHSLSSETIRLEEFYVKINLQKKKYRMFLEPLQRKHKYIHYSTV